ncbi:MAG: hypothetical protein SXQ77_01870, partial [Halobacteria archaeon]|nr:hypothetical protein [Halobacteria archaeon]
MLGISIGKIQGVLKNGDGGKYSEYLDRVSDASEAMIEGDFPEVDGLDRDDKIGETMRSFAELQGYVQTATRQADALARENYDADVLDESKSKGAMGNSIA